LPHTSPKQRYGIGGRPVSPSGCGLSAARTRL